MLTGLGRSGSPPATAMDHRLQVATNACFLEAKPAGGRSGQWAASKKRGGQLWVVCWPPPPYPDRPHGPNKRPLAVRLRPKDSNPSRRANSAPNAARGR